MTIPNRIRITSKVSYDIVYADIVDNDDSVRGICYSDKKMIVLWTGLKGAKQIETLIHEVIHAIEFEYKINIPHAVVYALEKAVLKFLKLNGWV